MLLIFRPVHDAHIQVLYDLLEERTPEQSISHKRMPEMHEHVDFVRSDPYKAWYIITTPGLYQTCRKIGAIYLTHKDEIGIAIFQEFRNKGYGKESVKKLKKIFPVKMYANINPDNYPSKLFFVDGLGAKLIQNTYVF